ncbi:response regulator transcription factor [Pseudonocardia xinjiangensis]|uniref:Response regulator transcription factor n=1 Tax=Pseudonocardia xinjiangensis TaxID=75289 RepID=A0ABX1RDE9_9PSEU|nr:response regulator transcription factor [Pseudonocardia xinjiangensis]
MRARSCALRVDQHRRTDREDEDPPPRILVIEDRTARSNTVVSAALELRDHLVSTVPTAMAGLRSAVTARPHLVLLDLELPDQCAIDLLPALRAAARAPVIAITSRADECHIVTALNAGADSCLIRPFSADLLLAKVGAALRADAGQLPDPPILVFGGLAIDIENRVVELDGGTLCLSPKEYDLLVYMALRAGEVVPLRDLLTEVWRLPDTYRCTTVQVHISWLRSKLRETARKPRYLHTVPGAGLRFEVPQDPPDTAHM